MNLRESCQKEKCPNRFLASGDHARDFVSSHEIGWIPGANKRRAKRGDEEVVSKVFLISPSFQFACFAEFDGYSFNAPYAARRWELSVAAFCAT